MRFKSKFGFGLFILGAFWVSAVYANNSNSNNRLDHNSMIQIINLYNYIDFNQCYMDSYTTRRNAANRSIDIYYTVGGRKRMEFNTYTIPTKEKNLIAHELFVPNIGIYHCLKAPSFTSRFIFENKLIAKLDSHNRKKIRYLLIKQGKIPANQPQGRK